MNRLPPVAAGHHGNSTTTLLAERSFIVQSPRTITTPPRPRTAKTKRRSRATCLVEFLQEMHQPPWQSAFWKSQTRTSWLIIHLRSTNNDRQPPVVSPTAATTCTRPLHDDSPHSDSSNSPGGTIHPLHDDSPHSISTIVLSGTTLPPSTSRHDRRRPALIPCTTTVLTITVAIVLVGYPPFVVLNNAESNSNDE